MFLNLIGAIDQQRTLVLLANKIEWQRFEDSFSKYYSQCMANRQNLFGTARAESIMLRQSYLFTLKKLNVLLRFQHTQQGSVQARKARKEMKTRNAESIYIVQP